MYCPQCGTESQTAVVQYCRVCGANLKVIGKAVSLSEAIARSDRGPLPKLKEMIKGLHVEYDVGEDISRAMEKMNQELAQMVGEKPAKQAKQTEQRVSRRRKKTPAERRENHITSGVVSLFSGVALTIFLYYLSGALVLKLPPDVIAKIPFEIGPVVKVIWLLGLLPTFTGVGHILAGLLIRPRPENELDQPNHPTRNLTEGEPSTAGAPASVTERTTNLLEHNY